jgi:hypothetical protein
MMAVIWFLLGGFVSGFSVASQWWFVQRLDVHSKPSLGWLFPAGMVIRLALTGALFWLALMQGILTGISFIVGLMVIRWGILIWINSRTTRIKQEKVA